MSEPDWPEVARRMQANINAKDARIAELEDRIARFGYPETARIELSTARAENEKLRKRVEESGAICDLALANTNSWKARAEQAEAQLAALKKEINRGR